MIMDQDSDDATNDSERFRRKFYREERHSDADERVVLELKNKVKKKKGRGFKETPCGRDSTRNKDEYERVRHRTEENDDDYLTDENFPQRSVEGWILMVTNLHEEIQEEDIMDKFGDFGPVKNMHLNLDRRTGFVKGYCLVEFETYREALLAKEAMNNSKILSQPMSVDWGFVKNARKTSVLEMKKRRRNRRY